MPRQNIKHPTKEIRRGIGFVLQKASYEVSENKTENHKGGHHACGARVPTEVLRNGVVENAPQIKYAHAKLYQKAGDDNYDSH